MVPSTKYLRMMLRSKFHLKYNRTNKANVKYLDQELDYKRKWVSRLIASFLIEDALIISIDESNLRHDSLPGR